MEQNCVNCNKPQLLNFPLYCEQCDNILCIDCIDESDICNICITAAIATATETIDVEPPAAIILNWNPFPSLLPVIIKMPVKVCTCSQQTRCSCGNLMRSCDVHYFYVEKTCGKCSETICDRCNYFCRNHGTKCLQCGSFADGTKFTNCEICNEAFCQVCKNNKFDIFSHANVCKSHQVECNYHSSHLFLPSLGCSGKHYEVPAYRCQYEDTAGKCKNYTCTAVIDYLEIQRIKGVYICHNHIYKCLICRYVRPLTHVNNLQNRGKTYMMCNDCFPRLKTYMEGVKVHNYIYFNEAIGLILDCFVTHK
jgi:hypothetical protein